MRRILMAIAVLMTAAWAPDIPAFKDTTAHAGITSVIISGGPKTNYVLEVNGSGACWLDYDTDGWMDIYLVNGATLANLRGEAPQQTTNHLYRNNHDGTFTDVTARAGVPGGGW